jgi:hypothetical protein
VVNGVSNEAEILRNLKTWSDVAALLTWRNLTRLSTILIIAMNLVPLVGIWLWNWDAFLLLILYWFETAIIAFWTMVRIGLLPVSELGGVVTSSGKHFAARLPLIAFFTLHSGIFMAVHFVFLWALFSGNWSNGVHGVAGFFDRVVGATGLWVPLIVLFIGRGLSFLFDAYGARWAVMLGVRVAGDPARASGPTIGGLVSGLYGRIIVMQFTIIFGAFLSFLAGSMAPLVLLILIKTVIDVLTHIAIDLGAARAPEKAVVV